VTRDDFLQRDASEFGDDRELPQARDAEGELLEGETEEGGVITPEERTGLTPTD
jgi:hypothetical protein